MRLNRVQRIAAAPQNKEEWQKLYYQHQATYLRRRLKAIKLLWEGNKLVDVCLRLECNLKSLRKWIDSYLSGGFKSLLAKKVSGKRGKGKLTKERLRILKYIILHKTPLDYGVDLYRWTLSLLGDLLKKKWGICLQKSQIQSILKEKLNLSYQKFHRDYANADVGAQKAFARDLNQRVENKKEGEVLIWFDEFSISTRPDASYAWAEKNSNPTIASNEKKEKDITGF